MTSLVSWVRPTDVPDRVPKVLSWGQKAPDRSAPLGVTKGCVAFQFPNKHPFFELLDKLKNRKKHMNELSHHFLE